MPNTTHRSHRSPRNARYDHARYDHGLDHCPAHCRYCGPDAGAWDVGEVVVGLLAAVAAVIAWLVRHPATVLALAIVVVTAWMVAGPQ